MISGHHEKVDFCVDQDDQLRLRDRAAGILLRVGQGIEGAVIEGANVVRTNVL